MTYISLIITESGEGTGIKKKNCPNSETKEIWVIHTEEEEEDILHSQDILQPGECHSRVSTI